MIIYKLFNYLVEVIRLVIKGLDKVRNVIRDLSK